MTQPSAPAPQIVIDSHDDKAWRDTLLKVAAILCERQPDSPQGYRLRRHALWQNITSTPQAESDGRTPLAAVSADMVADYHAQLGSADMALWQQVEKSVLLAPYWLDGHCLSAQTALRLGYKQVADAIRDEVIRFLERLPQLTGLLFNDHTPFISEQTKQWLAASPDAKVAPVAQIGEESKAARACFAEQGLEAALRYLDMLLNLTRSVKYSDADRAEIQRQLTEQYISDYTATWRAGMDNLNIRNFESIGQLTGALEQVISGDQPLQRALTVLRDNTQPGVFSEKLSAKEREEALAEPDYQLLTRLGHEFAPENSTLAVQKDKESTMQAVYQQLTELHRYLLAIQNAPVPGKSALKAVQLRLDQNSSDPIFATRQMAKTLPAPLNRWVGRLTDQAWHVVMVEAVHYMEVDWRDSVVKPFNEQLANNYPFNPRSAQDASLDAFERFFKPDGILDTFYQQNLKLFIDNDLSLEDGDNNVIIREDIIAQLETAQKIRDIFFSKQNGLGTSFAVETVSLSGNKRRSVLNLDGQLVDYSQGRNYTAHLVWPNNMREGNESKLTLIGTSGNAPRSISFSGPWAQFRLFGAGQLTGVQDGNFTVRFSVDGGAMTYRVHTDTEDNPFSGGLFSQFGLSDTLY